MMLARLGDTTAAPVLGAPSLNTCAQLAAMAASTTPLSPGDAASYALCQSQGMTQQPGSIGTPTPTTTTSTGFNTGIPFIGNIDFRNPMEIAIWGGIAASLALAKGPMKIVIPVALLAVRYELGKVSF